MHAGNERDACVSGAELDRDKLDAAPVRSTVIGARYYWSLVHF